jgi:hypothetical protein
MIWPFKDSGETKKRIAVLEQQVSQSRSDRYSKMFDLDKVGQGLDDMVKKSLEMLKTEDRKQ